MYSKFTDTAHQVDYTDTAGVMSTGISSYIYQVRIVSTSDCYIKFGNSPTATTSDHYLPSQTQEYVNCVPGQKISAIRVSSNGTLHVSEMTT